MTTKAHMMLVIGASASGKSTFARHIIDSGKGDVYTIRSLMTRPRRDTDRDEEVRFCSHANFRRMIGNKDLLEYEEFNHNYYGTSVSELSQAAVTPKSIKVIDPRGAQSIINFVQSHEGFNRMFGLHLVLVESDHNTLIDRLGLRGDAQSESRIDGLKKEIESCQALFNQYHGNLGVNRIYIDGEKPLPNFEFAMTPVAIRS